MSYYPLAVAITARAIADREIKSVRALRPSAVNSYPRLMGRSCRIFPQSEQLLFGYMPRWFPGRPAPRV